jgi:SAM-dependent methyltransferase
MMLTRYAPPPATVLDLGCGSGRAGLALAPQGYEVTGLDITWPMVAAARALYLQAGLQPDLLQADMRTLPCQAASYDVALILIAALQHIRGRAARQAALAEIGRVLRPGGVLILALDNIAPALTCYGWWGWRKVSSLGKKERAANTNHSADLLLASRRQQMSRAVWHLRGLARTVRWRTWNGLLAYGRHRHVLPGEPGDTAITQVSLRATKGYVYYHLYQHDELVKDAAVAGLELAGYHSGRELNEGSTFAPIVRQLDKQVLYAFRRP